MTVERGRAERVSGGRAVRCGVVFHMRRVREDCVRRGGSMLRYIPCSMELILTGSFYRTIGCDAAGAGVSLFPVRCEIRSREYHVIYTCHDHVYISMKRMYITCPLSILVML